MRPALGMAAACLLLLSCGGLRSLVEPQVEVRDVGVDSVTLRTVRGSVALDVRNPNPIALPVQAVDWELHIGGTRAATGRTDLDLTVPAEGEVPVVLGFRVGTGDALRVGGRLLRGKRDYRLTGTLHFGTPLGPIRVGITQDGDIRDRR